MGLELVGAIAIAAIVLWLVFQPMVAPGPPELALREPESPEESRRGVALLALKEIEFDRATGKLSDEDYEMLKGRFSAEALAAIASEGPGSGLGAPASDPEVLIAARVQQYRTPRAAGSEAAPFCSTCGPRPESDALYCSTCGGSLTPAAFCSSCGTSLEGGNRFCSACGTRSVA
jgi:hypothetical protein